MKRTVIAAVLAALLLAQALPCAAAEMPRVSGASVSALQGETVEYRVEISGNPGLAGFRLFLNYDEEALSVLTAEDGQEVLAERGSALPTGTLVASRARKGCQILWYSTGESALDGTLFTLRFRVAETAQPAVYPITLSYAPADTVNAGEEPVALSLQAGEIAVRSFSPTLYGGSCQVSPGEVFDFPVILQDNPGIASCGVKVFFDDASFELVQTPEGRPVSALGDCFSGGTLEMKAYADGAAALWYSAQETSASGELFSLRLRVKPGAKPGDQAIRLLCDPQQTLDAAEAPVSLETRDGTVTVLTSTKVTVTVSDAHSAAVRVESAPAAYAVAAFYSERGQLILSVLGAITDGSADIPVRAAAADLRNCTWQVFLLDREYAPVEKPFSAP